VLKMQRAGVPSALDLVMSFNSHVFFSYAFLCPW
jgi:hypothetical protein